MSPPSSEVTTPLAQGVTNMRKRNMRGYQENYAMSVITLHRNSFRGLADR
jgi:hypothetical protein